MDNLLQSVISKIEAVDPLHAKKIRKDLRNFDQEYFERADIFLRKFKTFLNNLGKNWDYAVTCYLKWIADIRYEQMRFFETGEYSSKSFEEVNQRVYSNPVIMEYHTIGLLLSRLLLGHNYRTLSFFVDVLPQYKNNIENYLEVGGGHGLFISEATSILNEDVKFDLVDISASSIEISKNFIDNQRTRFILSNIFKFETEKKYDFITMTDVLEHVEEPVLLLSRLRNLLKDDGVIYITVPANAAAIDHIYVFRNAQEIRKVIESAGLKVVYEIRVCAENVPEEKAEELKIALMYGAFINKLTI